MNLAEGRGPENEGVEPTAQAAERLLVRRLLARDPEAWSELIARFQQPVLGRLQYFAGRYGLPRDSAAIDDLLAETFARLLHNDFAALRSFRFGCRIGTWLTVIARRVCLRRLRKRSRETRFHATEGVAVEQIATRHTGPGPGSGEKFDSLCEKMKLLRDPDRQILELHYFEQLSYRQIGERLGLSANAVGPKLHRATSRLRKLMGPA